MRNLRCCRALGWLLHLWLEGQLLLDTPLGQQIVLPQYHVPSPKQHYWIFLIGLQYFFLIIIHTHTQKSVSVRTTVGLWAVCEGISLRRDAGGEGVNQAGAAARTSAEPLPMAFCFLLSEETQILSVASAECYLPKKKNPLVPCVLCEASQVSEHKLSRTEQLKQ